MQETSTSFVGKTATSIQLISKVKWDLLMVLLGYGSNDDSVFSIRKNKVSFNFSTSWIIFILVLTILEQGFSSRFQVALEFLLKFVKIDFLAIGLHKLCRTSPGFITGQYCNAYKEALSLQRLSSCKCILLSKWMYLLNVELLLNFLYFFQ